MATRNAAGICCSDRTKAVSIRLSCVRGSAFLILFPVYFMFNFLFLFMQSTDTVHTSSSSTVIINTRPQFKLDTINKRSRSQHWLQRPIVHPEQGHNYLILIGVFIQE